MSSHPPAPHQPQPFRMGDKKDPDQNRGRMITENSREIIGKGMTESTEDKLKHPGGQVLGPEPNPLDTATKTEDSIITNNAPHQPVALNHMDTGVKHNSNVVNNAPCQPLDLDLSGMITENSGRIVGKGMTESTEEKLKHPLMGQVLYF